MLKFISLSSSSKGNCYYIGNEEASVIIDAGIGARTIKKRLALHSVDIDSVDLILVTHNHHDHVKHLSTIVRRYNKPFAATGNLINSIDNSIFNRGIKSGYSRELLKDMPYVFKGVKVTAFEVLHDACETLGYHLDFSGEKITVVTDIGVITQQVIEYCKMAHHIVLESNYDEEMLAKGGYPQALIRRISGGKGHSSNLQTSSALKEIYHSEIKNIFLCHLSENNNTPELAYRQSYNSLLDIGAEAGRHYNLQCLPATDDICYNLL